MLVARCLHDCGAYIPALLKRTFDHLWLFMKLFFFPPLNWYHVSHPLYQIFIRLSYLVRPIHRVAYITQEDKEPQARTTVTIKREGVVEGSVSSTEHLTRKHKSPPCTESNFLQTTQIALRCTAKDLGTRHVKF